MIFILHPFVPDSPNPGTWVTNNGCKYPLCVTGMFTSRIIQINNNIEITILKQTIN